MQKKLMLNFFKNKRVYLYNLFSIISLIFVSYNFYQNKIIINFNLLKDIIFLATFYLIIYNLNGFYFFLRIQSKTKKLIHFIFINFKCSAMQIVLPNFIIQTIKFDLLSNFEKKSNLIKFFIQYYFIIFFFYIISAITLYFINLSQIYFLINYIKNYSIILIFLFVIFIFLIIIFKVKKNKFYNILNKNFLNTLNSKNIILIFLFFLLNYVLSLFFIYTLNEKLDIEVGLSLLMFIHSIIFLLNYIPFSFGLVSLRDVGLPSMMLTLNIINFEVYYIYLTYLILIKSFSSLISLLIASLCEYKKLLKYKNSNAK